jgi:hypothetical protein
MTDAPRVTIAGGGLAGLTAALRLAERGYRVKLYEEASWLGGDIGSRIMPDGRELDVYPHMYLSWYHNFWRLLDDVTPDDRDDRFHPFSGVKQLGRGDFPRFSGINEMFSRRHIVQNLFSGVGSPADMFVFGYASIDLLAERVNPTMGLENMSVAGFLEARPYMTDRAAAAFDSFITTVWAIPGYLTAAEDYRTYLDYSVADHTPAYWLAKGSAVRQVIGPLTAAAEAAGVELVPSVRVTSVACTGGRVTEIGLQGTRWDPDSYAWVSEGDGWNEAIDELILAVPPEALSSLVRSGGPGSAAVEVAPQLAEVSRLRTERIPVLHLFFTRKLPRIPPEPVSLFESRFALAFTDISQTWEGASKLGGETVLSLSASDPYGLPGTDPRDDAVAMLVELAEFLDFDPGIDWGDSKDIDWDQTRYEPNGDSQLFVNETGSEPSRPVAACEGIENLSFAGDFCANRIGMTTIESAVTTGLEAARVIVGRRGIGDPVEITEPGLGSSALYVWIRYAWAPYVAVAKAWSSGSDHVKSLRGFLTPGKRSGD